MERDAFDELETDVLVVGGEGAGGRAAISASDFTSRVTIASKGIFGGSGATCTAVYSVCAAFGHADPRDNPREHFVDTVRGGHYLSHQKLVEVFVNDAPRRVLELERFGAKFEKHPDGRFKQELMPGHRYARAAHYKTSMGFEFRRALGREIKRRGIEVREDFMVLDVLVHDGRVAGALALDVARRRLVLVRARAVVLATGGCMEIYYPHTDTCSDLTGDGYAVALRTGADLVDMEFMQFFPTAVVWPPTLRGTTTISMLRYKCNGRLLNRQGERFMIKYDPIHVDQANRDITSRAIVTEIVEGRGSGHGGVYLDVSYLPRNLVQAFIDEYFPNFVVKGFNILEAGVDPRVDAVEVAPAAHYMIGGIRVDERAASTLGGMFAAGEASAGVHGANRIEGNGLPETQVTGALAGESAGRFCREVDHAPLDHGLARELARRYIAPLTRDDGIQHFEVRRRLQETMWQQVGLVRSGAALRQALATLEQLADACERRVVVRTRESSFNREWLGAIETRNMVLVGRAMASAALEREESRGSHYRTDFSRENDPRWLLNHAVRLTARGLEVERAPLVITTLDPAADVAATSAPRQLAADEAGAEELL